MIEDSDDNYKVIGNIGDNNSTDNSSKSDDEMETGSINDNCKNVFIVPVKLISILF